MKKVAGIIVNIRYLIFLLIAVAVAFSVVSSKWVKVENDLVEYLPETSETRIGQRLMEDQFYTYGSAEVMVANITVEDAEKLCSQLEEISSVKSVDFDSESTNYYNDVSALYQITFEYSEDDARCQDAMQALRDCTADYDAYIQSDVENTLEDTIEQEVFVIKIYVAVIVLVVLLLTTTSFGEVPALCITFIVAMLLNNGTNFLLGKISFVSNSVTSILQLALSLDYAIILCNHYKEEHKTLPIKEAVVEALSKSIPEIGSSCLTTLGGFVAMLFMTFKLGGDMGICLMKAVIISILTVFILMPGLLVLFGPLIDRTTHKTIVPDMQILGRFAYKTRKIVPVVFLGLIVGAFLLQRNCPYVFGYSNIVTPKQNDSQVVEKMIEDTFTNPSKLAVIVPTGDYGKEGDLIHKLEKYPEVDHITGLANSEAMDGYMVTDRLTPRQFSELLDIDYNSAELLYTAYATENDELSRIAGGLSNYKIMLMDMLLYVNSQVQNEVIALDDEDAKTLADAADAIESGKKQLLGEDFSRIVVYLKQDVQDKRAYECIDSMRSDCQKEYPNGEVYVIGELTNEYDFKKSFETDNIKVSIISILIVMTVLLFTFKSIGMPVLLILTIQGSIWLNFAIPAVTGEPLMFMANLVVSAIQMGANIDYAIVIGSRYNYARQSMDKEPAIADTMKFAFPTIMTSGTILAVAGILIGGMTSEATIVGIGQSVGRGTIISMILVLFVLPQILLLGEGFVNKTSVSFKGLIEKDRIAAAVLMLLCAGFIFATPFTAQAATAKRIEITNEDELKNLADDCRLDSWSSGKTVELKNDIRLEKYRNISIPAFSGTFNGNGHEISGLSIDAQTSYAGLFCHVMKNGQVNNLKVSGRITAEDEDLTVGGIAGRNDGIIRYCSFHGDIEGQSRVGGIVGMNSRDGVLRHCTAYGSVSAKTSGGGIAGENEGRIFTSINCSTVNSMTVDPGIDIESIEGGTVLELSKLIAPSSYGITQDIGGICGISSGTVYGCSNKASVGTDHIGYNVGGIAGRNTGLVTKCENSGEVYGRKDIGGIVGQAEPYTEIKLTADRLDELESQADELKSKTERLEKQSGDLADDVQSDIGSMIETIHALDDNLHSMRSAVSSKLDSTGNDLDDIQGDADLALTRLESSANSLDSAGDAIGALADVYANDVNKIADSADSLSDGQKQQLKDNAQTVVADALTISGLARNAVPVAQSIANDILTSDAAQLASDISAMGTILDGITAASAEMDAAVAGTAVIVDSIPDPDIDAAGSLKNSAALLKASVKDVNDSITSAKKAGEVISGRRYYDTSISSPEITVSADAMLETLDKLVAQSDGLYSMVSAEDDGPRKEIREIRELGNGMIDSIIGAADDVRDIDNYVSDDTYDQMETMVYGKTSQCENTGVIRGDINAGGIAGSMAHEKDFDPEDDKLDVSTAYRKRYRLSDAILECSNRGTVIARKNYCGGICGKQDIGVIKSCGSYGFVSSEDGKYVGGITGVCCADIDSCYSKCILGGKKFLGGITGTGFSDEYIEEESTVKNCVSMATLPDDAVFVGMISGADKGRYEKNIFVSESDSGIGGVSYSGRAEPVSYSQIRKRRDTPSEFETMNVYFMREGGLIEKRKVSYGESIDVSDYPKLSDNDGCYGKWINPDTAKVCRDTVVNAEDCRYVTSINSDLKKSPKSERPMFIVEGHYTGEADFNAQACGDGVFRLHIPDDGSSEHVIRYNADGEDMDRLRITCTDDANNESHPQTTRMGRSVKFTVSGNDVTVIIEQTKKKL